MKKLPFLLLVAALIVAVFLIPSQTASAEEASFDYFTTNYYEFGRLFEIYEENGRIYAFEEDESGLYLRVVGEANAKILITRSIDENIRYKLCAINGVVYFYDGGDYLKTVDLNDGIIKDSVFPTVEKQGKLSFGFSALTIDLTNEVLFVAYQSVVLGYDLDKLAKGSSLIEANVFLEQIGSEYEHVLIEGAYSGGVKLCFYNSSDGKVYTLDKRSYESENIETHSSQALYYQGGAYYAKYLSGAEKVENGVSVKTEDGDIIIDFSSGADYAIETLGGMFGSDRLYVLDNGQKAIKVFAYDGESLVLDELYGSYGYGDGDNSKGLTRFYSPSLIAATDKCLAVYDEGNGRIVAIIDGVTQPSRAAEGVESLCVAGMNGKYGVWYKKGDKIYSYDPTTTSPEAEFELLNLEYIGFNGTVSAYAGGKIYVYKNNGFEEFFSVRGDVKCGMHDGIYYAYDKGFTMYKDGEVIITLPEESDFDDYFSDYKGNIWLKKGKKAYAYMRLPSSFNKKEYDLSVDATSIAATSSGGVYALYKNAIISISLPVASSLDEGEFSGEKYEDNYRLASSKGCWAYESLDNYESILRLEEGVTSVLFEKVEYLGGVYYRGEILRNGEYRRTYVAEGDLEILENRVEEGLYVKYMGLDREPKGYEYPSKSAKAVVDIPKDIALEVVYSVGAEGDVWYAVKADGKTCYVEKNNNYVVDKKPYVEIKRYYAYVSLTRLGGSCPIYASPDEESEVLALLTDGAKVEMPETIDYDEEYTRIRYEEGYAYVKTAYLQEKGLTIGQKFAIIFGSVAFVLTVVPLVLVFVIRRRKR